MVIRQMQWTDGRHPNYLHHYPSKIRSPVNLKVLFLCAQDNALRGHLRTCSFRASLLHWRLLGASEKETKNGSEICAEHTGTHLWIHLFYWSTSVKYNITDCLMFWEWSLERTSYLTERYISGKERHAVLLVFGIYSCCNLISYLLFDVFCIINSIRFSVFSLKK